MPDQHAAATEHAILQEITGPLESLPNDPLSAIGADFPMALRGYDRPAVDEYVRQTRRLVAELQATRSPEAAVRRALERVGEQISGILQRAHETAEQITAQSRIEAEDRLEEARVEARQIIAAAEQRVRELDADTDRIWLERQRIVADAEDLAAQLQAVARTAAQRFPEDDEAETVGGAFGPPEPAGAFGPPEPAGAFGPPEPAGGAFEPPEPAADEPEPEEQPAPPSPAAAGDGPDQSDAPEAEDPADDETVAFQPMGSDPPAAEPPPAEPPLVEPPPTADEETTAVHRPDAEDTTAVIPPASQAANRRLRDD